MEENRSLISVIVPVYKAEIYLNACIDSILAQTYKNLEIILVDDGSPDDSGKICDDYAEKDSRIKVIHKENGGVSSARNAGLDAAVGAYIAFIDSDDTIHPKMIEELYKKLVEAGADISSSSYVRCYSPSDRVPDEFKNEKIYEFSCEEAVCALTLRKKFGVQIWAKLYRAEILESVRFDGSISVAEDMLFLTEAIMNSKKLVFFTRPLYNYVQRSESIMHTAFGDKNMTSHDAAMKMIALGNERSLSKKTRDHLQATAIILCIYTAYELISQKEIAKKYIKTIKKNIRGHISKGSLAVLPRSRRIQAVLLSFSYTLFKLFFKLAGTKKSA